jgi:hypothetical protein
VFVHMRKQMSKDAHSISCVGVVFACFTTHTHSTIRRHPVTFAETSAGLSLDVSMSTNSRAQRFRHGLEPTQQGNVSHKPHVDGHACVHVCVCCMHVDGLLCVMQRDEDLLLHAHANIFADSLVWMCVCVCVCVCECVFVWWLMTCS